LQAPYRYNRRFFGEITDGERTWQDSYDLFVRYKGVVPSASGMLEKELFNRGLLRREACGASSIGCLDEPDGYEMVVRHLRENVDCYIAEDPKNRDTEFIARNMVAL
jgi:aminoglycoside 3-N-acetyltransferase